MYGDTLDTNGPVTAYSSLYLRALFTRYPTLRRVSWVSGYPTDPFAEVLDGCHVDRPELVRGKLGSLEPYWVGKEMSVARDE